MGFKIAFEFGPQLYEEVLPKKIQKVFNDMQKECQLQLYEMETHQDFEIFRRMSDIFSEEVDDMQKESQLQEEDLQKKLVDRQKKHSSQLHEYEFLTSPFYQHLSITFWQSKYEDTVENDANTYSAKVKPWANLDNNKTKKPK